MNTPAVSTRGRPDATGASVTSGMRGTDGRHVHQVSIRIDPGPGSKVAHCNFVFVSISVDMYNVFVCFSSQCWMQHPEELSPACPVCVQ